MGRPKGAKDKHPRKSRWSRPALCIVKPAPGTPGKDELVAIEDCLRIVELAKKKGEMLDLWITLDAFRRMKRL